MATYIRRILVLVINGALTFPLAAAQQSAVPPDNPPGAAAGQGDQGRRQQARGPGFLAQYLNLTNEQKRDWVRIQKETTQNVWAARKDESLNEQQMQRKLREIHAEQKQQLLALLTPEQQEFLKKWWEEQKQKAADSATGNANPSDASPGTAVSKDDDFFAGMVRDDDLDNAPPANRKKPSPRKP